jgi:hypothetical protein
MARWELPLSKTLLTVARATGTPTLDVVEPSICQLQDTFSLHLQLDFGRFLLAVIPRFDTPTRPEAG